MDGVWSTFGTLQCNETIWNCAEDHQLRWILQGSVAPVIMVDKQTDTKVLPSELFITHLIPKELAAREIEAVQSREASGWVLFRVCV
jgi:hypothetical protein